MRLIDSDELIERTWRWAINSREAVQQMIKGCPTIDAVPVVRCKDCKYAKKELFSKTLSCVMWGDKFSPEDFCSTGKRRDDADE